MLHRNLKKFLVLGTVLSALGINMAFAADNASAKNSTPPQQLTDTAKRLDTEDIFEELFDLDDIDDLEDFKDVLKEHHRHHHDRDWDEDEWEDDDCRHDLRKEREERIDEAMKHLSSSQKREVLRFIERDRAFHRERCEALRHMNAQQREAVRAHYYGHRGHYNSHQGHGCRRY